MNYSVIIAEFNPLSNGHKKIIEKTKELFPTDGILVVMSGNFVERGEPAIVDEYKRASVATSLGVDAVIELPLYFSSSSAEDFAFGAIKIASSIPSVKRIVFGSECGDINLLNQAVEAVCDQSIKENLKAELKKGVSFASSIINSLPKKEREILSSPNNILAVEYLKAIKILGVKIDAVTIKRENNFNDNTLKEFASASALRKALNEGKTHALTGKMPKVMLDHLKQSPKVNLDRLFSMIYYAILREPVENLAKIHGVTEGLEYRIKEGFLGTKSLDELVNTLSSKRHQKGKIRRILLNILFFVTKDLMETAKTTPPIIKLLSVGENKNEVLRDLSKTSGVLLTKAKDTKNLTQEQQLLFHLNERANNVYAFISSTEPNGFFKTKF